MGDNKMKTYTEQIVILKT